MAKFIAPYLRNSATPCHHPTMQVFSILARKGGVGKSLLARSLAVQALIDGRKAAILDADPQETIVSWGTRRQPTAPLIVGLGSRKMRDALDEIEGREEILSSSTLHPTPSPSSTLPPTLPTFACW